MELDHIILEKICLHKYNKDADQPVLINLRDWQVFNTEATLKSQNNWHAVCYFSVGKGTRWFGQDSIVVYADEYMRELTTTQREEKLNKLGIK
jgi:hypothetical protein